MLRNIPYLTQALEIPYLHHEHWNGSGYPLGLKETQIPLAARIFTVIDVYDALLSNRPYRRAWPRHKVHNYLRANAGKLFDPQIVDTFLRLVV
jgi:HD-GYP domain-containing protein (c-di-GMP phosphodiesterase class II)